MKKIFHILAVLILVLLVSLMPCQTKAADKLTYGDFYYTVKGDGTVEIAGRASNNLILNIPSTIDGKTVTSIAAYAFRFDKVVASITMPDTITAIGSSAFQGCDALSSLTLSKNIQAIPSQMCYQDGKLVTIEIPEGVTSIGSEAFSECGALMRANVPNSCTSIGKAAFCKCYSLIQLVLGNNIQTIGDTAFYGCAVVNFELPDSVQSIGNECFKACKQLVSFNTPSKVMRIPDECFRNCTALKSFNFNNVIAIGSRAFAGCTGLFPVTIPDSVLSISPSVFDNSIYVSSTYSMNYKADIPWLTCDSSKTSKDAIKSYGDDTITHVEGETTKVTPASFSITGQIATSCPACKESFDVKQIPAILSVTCTDSLQYNGKAQKPAITVKLADGSKFDMKYFSVKYSGNKKVGVGKAVVTFKGNYKGSKTLQFTINPRNVNLKSVSTGKKKITATWSTSTKEIDGYEIRYSTNKKFIKKTTKTKIVKSAKTSKVSLTGCKSKKNYYVAIRSYKTAGGKKYYSTWSSTKSIKVK